MSSRKLTKRDRSGHERANTGVKIYNSDDDRPKAHIVSSDSHWRELQYQKYLRMRMRQGLREKEALLVDGKGRLITLAERILRFRLHRQNGVQGEAESGMSRTPAETKREKANLRTLLNQYIQQREKERALSAEIIGEINAAKLSFKEDQSLQGLSPTKSYVCGISSSTNGVRDSSSNEQVLDDEEKIEVHGRTAMSGDQRTGHSRRTSNYFSRFAEFGGVRKTIIVDEDGSVLERVQVSEESRQVLEGTKESEKDNVPSKEDKNLGKNGGVVRDMLDAGEKVEDLKRTRDMVFNGRVFKRTGSMTQNLDNLKRSEHLDEQGSTLKSNINAENNWSIVEKTKGTEQNTNILKRTENMEYNRNIQNKNEEVKYNERTLRRNEDATGNDSFQKTTVVTEKSMNVLKRSEDEEYLGSNRINADSEGGIGEQSNGASTASNSQSQMEEKPKIEVKHGVLSSVLLEQNGKSYSSMDAMAPVNLNQKTDISFYENMNTVKCRHLETGERDELENNATKDLIQYGEAIEKIECTEMEIENDASSNKAAFSFVVEEQTTKEINSSVSDFAVDEEAGLFISKVDKNISDEIYRNQSDETGAETNEQTSVSSNGLKRELKTPPKCIMKQTEGSTSKRPHACDNAKPNHAIRRKSTEKLYGIRHATVLEKIRSKTFMPTSLPNESNETYRRRTPKDVLAYLSRGNTEDSEESLESNDFTAGNNKIYEFIDYLNQRSYTLPEIVLQCNQKQQSNKRNTQKAMQRANGIKSQLLSTNLLQAITSDEKQNAKTLLPRLFHERTNSTLSSRGHALGERPKTILPSLQGSHFSHFTQHSISGSHINQKSERLHKVKSIVHLESTRGSGTSFPEETGSNLEDLDDREKRIIALHNDLSSYCAFQSSPSDVSISMHRKQSRLNMRIEWGIIPKENDKYFSRVRAKKYRKSTKKNNFLSSSSVSTEREVSEDSFKANCDGNKKQFSDHFIYLREISFSRFIQQSEMESRMKKYLEPVPELQESVSSKIKKVGSSEIQESVRKKKAGAHDLSSIETKPNLSLTVCRHANCFGFHSKRRLE